MVAFGCQSREMLVKEFPQKNVNARKLMKIQCPIPVAFDQKSRYNGQLWAIRFKLTKVDPKKDAAAVKARGFR